MRMSKYFLGTVQKRYRDNDIVSYQLMLRAGLIRKVSAGLYVWLPTGFRILQKLKGIIREEMNKIGAIEIYLPIVQPANLWKISGRWTQYGPELLRFKNRSNQDFVLSPTHEELISKIISKEIFSYKQLPLILYQIQNKFRDEIRPRFGMFRSREFIMKDGYSFHINNESLKHTYEIIYHAYKSIFNKLNLNFRVIKGNSGNIGGHISHEFHAIVNNGEDVIVCSTESNYSESIDSAESIPSTIVDAELNVIQEKFRLITINNIREIIDIFSKCKVPREKFVRTFIIHANKNFKFKFLAILIRSDHELNYAKVERLPQVKCPLSFANEDEICSLIGINSSVTLGPINLPIPIIADRSVISIKNFISGANIDNGYFFGINWGRDLPFPEIKDLRKVISGDQSPDGNGILKVYNSIEIAHIFQLGNKYLHSFSYNVQGKDKKPINLVMGCYGIGVSRVIASVIEQNNDKYGITWPDILAPFILAIIPINMYRSCSVFKVAERLYKKFSVLKIDILFDDRDESAGIKFSDIELIGIPHIIIISEKTLNVNAVEYRHRRSKIVKIIKVDEVLDFFLSMLLSKI